MILDEIKKANIDALKTKDTTARNFYSVLLNKIKLEEIKRRDTNSTLVDADVVQIIQKSIKELNEELANYEKVNKTEEVLEIKKQLELAKKYLPKMLSDQEIKDIILKLDDKSIPSVMRHFKENYAGKCDMRKVQEVLKSL